MRGIGVLLIAAAGCGPAMWGQTDDFPDKLKKGCRNLEECEALELEARGRVERCKDNTVGYVRCSDARADLQAARALSSRWERRRDEEERERQVARQERLEKERLAEARERIDQQERHRREEEERRQAEIREREEQVKRTDAEYRAQRIEFFRTLNVQQREARLRECYDDRPDCDEFLLLLLEATDSDKDKTRLRNANERLRARKPAAESTSAGRAVRCCDGSSSPTCVCGGSLRGCCSRHRGVCGCE